MLAHNIPITLFVKYNGVILAQDEVKVFVLHGDYLILSVCGEKKLCIRAYLTSTPKIDSGQILGMRAKKLPDYGEGFLPRCLECFRS